MARTGGTLGAGTQSVAEGNTPGEIATMSSPWSCWELVTWPCWLSSVGKTSAAGLIAGCRQPSCFALTNSGADLRPKRDSAAPLYAFPGLATVRQPLATMGSTAATMLLQLINGQNPHGTHLQLAIELIVRHHAGPRGALSNSNGCSGFSRRHTSDADIGCKAVVQCLFIHSCKQ